MKNFAAFAFSVALLAGPALAAPPSPAETQKRMDALLTETYQPGAPGMAAIVVKDGKPVLRRAIGMANIELGVPLKPDMVFRLGSITKQFTAVAILMLVNEGKVALDDEITKFLPDYPVQGQKITVEHLLTHTSGIRSYTEMASWPPLWRKDFTVAELIDLFKNEPMTFKPGEKYAYNNSGYILLGAIIEKASGKTYAEFIQQRIFTPLGMKHSYYGETEPLIPGRVAGYQVSAKGTVNAPYLSMTQPYAAGSLLSSVDDLALWNASLSTEKLLPRALLDKAWTPYKLNDGSTSGYGYGWQMWTYRGHRVVEHGGGIHGFSTAGFSLPDDKLYVSVLTNGGGRMVPGEVAVQLAALAIGEPFVQPSVAKVGGETLDRYAGAFGVDGKASWNLQREGDHLVSIQGETKRHWYPSSETEFFRKDGLGRIRFERDTKGAAVALIATGYRGDDRRFDRVAGEAPKTP